MKKIIKLIKENINHIIQVIKFDTDTDEVEIKRAEVAVVVLSVAFIISSIMTVINILMQSWFMGFTTFALALYCLLARIFLFRIENKNLLYISFEIAISIMFCIYYITGGNDGFAALWIVLIPMVLVATFGINLGMPMGFFFVVFLCVISYTPLKNLVIYDYNENFVNRFPILYLASFLFMTRIGIQEKESKIKALHQVDNLESAVELERKKNVENSIKTITTIVNAMEARDPYTRNHSLRVAAYSKAIGQKLGFNREKLNRIYLAGMVHDIGKINMPDRVLNKSDTLTPEEWAMVKEHPETGFKIVREYDNVVRGIGDAVRFHHEHVDGTGYPYGLKGDKIPQFAKIVAVADAFDAMSSKRVFRDKATMEYAVGQIREGAGSQFDKTIALMFVDMLEKGEVKIQED